MKGEYGDPKNYRGITVSSNVLKLMEKLMANRYSKEIEMTEFQGGSKKGSSTRDHIFVILALIKKFRCRGLHIIFLDISKAFDKAWREGIMNVMSKRGCNNQDWIYMDLLNKNSTVQVKTPFGITEKIKVNKIIKQGAVSSPIQFGLLIDEIGKKLFEEKKGLLLDTQNVPCLLWVDDIMVAHTAYTKLQKMIDSIYEISRKYRLKFGLDKCNHLIIGTDHYPHKNIKLGEDIIEKINIYKYLGINMNNKSNLKDHINIVNGKITSAVNTIANVTSNKKLKNLQTETIIDMCNSIINSIISYGMEPYKLHKYEIIAYQKMQINAIKDLFELPRSSPDICILMELGIIDIKYEIYKRTIIYYKQLKTNNLKNNADKSKKTLLDNAYTIRKDWIDYVQEMMKEINIEDNDLNLDNEKLKEKIKQNSIIKMYKDMKEESDNYIKSKAINNNNNNNSNNKKNNKVNNKDNKKNNFNLTKKRKLVHQYLTRTQNEERTFKKNYINKYNKNQTKAIIETRMGLFPCNNNYKHIKNETDKCRFCQEATETEDHLLKECELSPIYIKNSNNATNNFNNVTFGNKIDYNKIINNYKKMKNEINNRNERY